MRVPFNDAGALARALAGNDVAAFVIDRSRAGRHLPGDGYLAEAAVLCRRHHTLLVADEIQCGLGRVGRFLACEPSASSRPRPAREVALRRLRPVGAVAMRGSVYERVYDRMERAFVHGSTFSKNDLAMAAGLATLAVIDEERLIESAADQGERLIHGLRARLLASELVKEVRGKGLMIAIELGPPRSLKLKATYALVERAARACSVS